MVRPDRTYTRKVEIQAYVIVITAGTDKMNVKGTCRKLDVPFAKLHYCIKVRIKSVQFHYTINPLEKS